MAAAEQNPGKLLALLHQQRPLSNYLLINPPDAHTAELAGAECRGVLCDNYASYQHIKSSLKTDLEIWFGCALPGFVDCVSVVIFLPKGRDRLGAQLALLHQRVPADTEIIVIGAKDAGIAGAGKQMQRLLGDARKILSARHCSAWSSSLPESSEPAVEVEDMAKQHAISVAGKQFASIELPGVFARGQLDSGSEMLLDCLREIPIKGDALDFGCGAGVLTIALLMHNPDLNISAVDVDAWALQATKLSLQANHLDSRNKKIQSVNGADDIHDKFDWIITNPPFHQGHQQTTSVTDQLLRRAPEILRENGQLWLVANRFLNYEEKLRCVGMNVEQVAADRSYKVLTATKSRQ